MFIEKAQHEQIFQKICNFSLLQVKNDYFCTHLCPGGEIGRHASLRGWCPYGCASSSLVLGTLVSSN